MKPWTFTLLVIAAALSKPATGAAQISAPHIPTVLIAAFETDRTGWVPPPRLGATVADLLTDQLVASGRYRVLDPQFLFGQLVPDAPVDLRALSEHAADIGLEYLVTGSVTRFSTERVQRSAVALLPLLLRSRFPAPVFGAGGGSRTEAVLSINARVINVRTGEVVATIAADGVGSRDQKHLATAGLASNGPFAGGLSKNSQDSWDALLAEALEDAVSIIGEALRSAAPRIARGERPGQLGFIEETLR